MGAMMRLVIISALVGLSGAASVLRATPVHNILQFKQEQRKAGHSECVTACAPPSPVESKCVTACEVAVYKCIDHTGPNETEEDTKKCIDKVLKLYQETKGLEKKEEKKEGKKEEKKEAKKGFLQAEGNDAVDGSKSAGTPVHNIVQFKQEQRKAGHSKCVTACQPPSPVESQCVTACETAVYKCI